MPLSKKQGAEQGFGAAIGSSATLTQGLVDRNTKKQEAQGERTERKEAILEEEMKSRSVKPQEWEAGYNAYMAQKAAEEKQKAEELQAGLAAYYSAMKQGEQEAQARVEQEKTWWEKTGERFSQTLSSGSDWTNRIIGAVPDGWRGFLLSPLQIAKQKKGSNLVVSVKQETLDIVSSVTGWIERKLHWTGIESVPGNKLGYYDRLAEQGLDINPTGNLSPKKWMDRLLDVVLNRKSKTLVKETVEGAAEETVEVAAKGSLRNSLKTWSPAIFDGIIEGTFNAYDYLWGEKKNEVDKFQKWAVSSGVDTVGSLLTGGAAALTAAGILYLVGGAVTIPATVVVVGTMGIGALFDAVLESTGIKDSIKETLNAYIDNEQALSTTSPAQSAVPVPTPSIEPHSTSIPAAVSTTPMPPSPIITSQVTPAQIPTPNQTPEP